MTTPAPAPYGRSCLIDGCEKPIRSSGTEWCNAHWTRNRRNGHPLAGKASPGEHLAWLKEKLEDPGDDCITWPFRTDDDGYGVLKFEGRPARAARVALVLHTGQSGDVARHGCRTRLCINPRHLSWGTHEDNMHDRRRDGTAGFKLTEDDVREIVRRRAAGESQSKVAAAFGVGVGAIAAIDNGRTWAWLTTLIADAPNPERTVRGLEVPL